ncbi:hypothetical protein L1887_32898 [Cichorium endivia]|nr:hypothetical protein L1887_32898 [Cichorium endivia]
MGNPRRAYLSLPVSSAFECVTPPQARVEEWFIPGGASASPASHAGGKLLSGRPSSPATIPSSETHFFDGGEPVLHQVELPSPAALLSGDCLLIVAHLFRLNHCFRRQWVKPNQLLHHPYFKRCLQLPPSLINISFQSPPSTTE